MNPRTLPVKRHPVSKGFFKRIHAVTRHRNQRVVATATAEDLENEDQSSRISRGFTIIFLIHVVAIALYFIHLNFLNDHSVAKTTPPAVAIAAVPKPRIDNPPMLGPDDATCIVVAGDNYARIAAREGVDEAALRAANQNKPIAAGLTFKLPPKRIVAKDSPMVVALRKQASSGGDRGLVETPPAQAGETTRPLLVHPKVTHEATPAKSVKESTPAKSVKETTTAKSAKESAPAKTAKESTAAKAAKESATAKAAKDSPPAKSAPVSAKQTYVVKSGDNLYRISKRYKIDQTALMRANNISDPAKLNSGMTLVIPH